MFQNVLANAFRELSPVSVGIAVATVVVTIAYYCLKSRGLPPGPTGVPFFGYWPFLNSTTCHFQLGALSKKYGDVFSFTCNGILYIHLGSVKAVREAYITKPEYFATRMTKYNFISYLLAGGVTYSNGEKWKVLRKSFVQSVKEHGILSLKSNRSIHDTVSSTVEDLRKLNGEPVNIIELLLDKCTTVLRLTLLGENGASEEQMREINKFNAPVTSNLTPLNTFLGGSILRLVYAFMPSYRESLRGLRELERLYYKIIDDHNATYEEGITRDIIDEYIKERNEKRSKGDPTARYFTDQALMATMVQFVGDAVISIASYIGLMVKALLEHPEEQQKLYDELMEVVGLDREPTIEDKSNLTYLNAFIQEVTRTSDFFPLVPGLECTTETTLQGQRIPKGAVTVLNTWCAHKDPNVYPEPEKFNPSRFMSTEGRKQKAEPPIAFGIGKRACLGEGYTMMQVFIFLSSIIKNFHLKLSDDTITPTSELFLTGKLQVRVCPRKHKQ